LIQTIYPQPAEDNVLIKFYGHENATVVIEVLDITGKLVITVNKNISADAVVDLDLNGLSAGVYFLKVNAKEVTEVKKIVLE
jgi:formiminotetrahydrofolate cyclodeaminase